MGVKSIMFSFWVSSMFAGERGPKGDHGQPGEAGTPGARGAQGKEPKTAKFFRTALTIWIIIFSVAVGWQVAQNRNRINDLRRTETALCNLRTDLVRRNETSRQFLKENPQGIPGITAAAIKTSIKNSERTIKSLSNLRCPPPENP
jgi:hypothetical protein